LWTLFPIWIALGYLCYQDTQHEKQKKKNNEDPFYQKQEQTEQQQSTSLHQILRHENGILISQEKK